DLWIAGSRAARRSSATQKRGMARESGEGRKTGSRFAFMYLAARRKRSRPLRSLKEPGKRLIMPSQERSPLPRTFLGRFAMPLMGCARARFPRPHQFPLQGITDGKNQPQRLARDRQPPVLRQKRTQQKRPRAVVFLVQRGDPE